MTNIKKTAITMILVIAMMISSFAGFGLLNTTASAASYSNVTAKLNTIINGKYGNNKVFPYDGVSVPASLAGVKGGQQCFGFSRYVFYQVFNLPAPTLIDRNSDELCLNYTGGNGITMREVASCKYSFRPNGNTAAISKSAFAQARPGDIVQCRRRSGSAHTMVVYSVSSNSIRILDCNVMTNKPNTVLLRDESYSNFAYYNPNFTIYRAINYDKINGTTTQTKPASSKPTSYFAPASISGSGSLAVLATSVNKLKGTHYTEADIRQLNTNKSASAYWGVLESKLGIKDSVTKVGSMWQFSKISRIASLADKAASGAIVQIDSSNSDGTRYILCIGRSGLDLLVLDPFSKNYDPISLKKYCSNKGLSYSATLSRIQTVWTYTAA